MKAECTDFAIAPEFILHEDGGNSDIGYAWPVLLDKNRVMIVHYFNSDNGARSIEGTILKITDLKLIYLYCLFGFDYP
ncbi:hypothetical protein [Daejeonella sp. H1SJ63]|uniref:hypothetical protein n=1 Tax=Daejeonella sp. H1SJ63 TaxID=3034145 RepID=UPI0023EA9662|nr:hypothetical protein [Daejeonella sp. H1SJ63]